jgi:hypothetical protein
MKTTFRKQRQMWLGTMVVLGTMVSFVSCKKDTRWNSNWVLPLVNDTLDLKNFVNDSTLSVNNGLYVLDLKRNIYNFNLTDIVAIPDTVITRVVPMPFNNLTVNPGFEFYNKVEEHLLDLQDLELKLIKLKSGKIDFELTNPVETGVFVTVQLPGVYKNGVVLEETIFVESGTIAHPTVKKSSVNLAECEINLTGKFGNSFNKLQSLVKIKSDPNGNSVVIKNTHVFNVHSKFGDVQLDYARGYFGNRELKDTSTFNFDLLTKITAGSIDLQNASVKLILENGIKVGAKGIVQFAKNYNLNTGGIVSLTGGSMNNEFTIDQPTGSYATLQPSVRELLFNSSNSNVKQFIENLGVKNEVSYKLKLNPWGNTTAGWNEVFPQSRLRLTLEAQLPLAFRMDNLTIRDTFAINFQQKENKTHAESGVLQILVDNAFPMAAKLKVSFLDENKNVLTTVDATQDIASSLYGELNAQGLFHKTSTVDIPLSKEVVTSINDAKSMIIQAQFNTPAPGNSTNQTVFIPADAYMSIKAKAKIGLKMVL